VSFDWAEYLSLAEELHGAPVSGPPVGTEARQRASVSRAYYGSYILARNHLRDIDGIRIPRGANPHRFVAEQYANHRDPIRMQIGDELARLRAARNRCDYDDVVVQLPQLVTVSLARAALIVADLARL
jgi:hypothetical protein